jgi:hypothetical protein
MLLIQWDSKSETFKMSHFYKIGTAGKPWGDEERAAWLTLADVVKRSYADEVLAKLEPLKEIFDVEQCVLTFCLPLRSHRLAATTFRFIELSNLGMRPPQAKPLLLGY